jgi:predicted dehydrogenase
MSVRVALAGLGYWGTNLARNLGSIEGCEVVWGCDTNGANRERFRASFPGARLTPEFESVLSDPEVDAVVISTPPSTHAELAQRAIEADKDCFVEKPLSTEVAAAERTAGLAEERGRVLMVGHLLCYHPGVRLLADLVRAGELGDIHYLYSQRVNLGRLRATENALWSLGAHDVSVLTELVAGDPVEASARGEAYLREGVEDVVFAHLRFDSGIAAHMHLSWLDPNKQRRITVVGAERMATLDDMQPERKLTVFDKGFDPPADGSNELVSRSGAVWSPRLSGEEPLRLECEHFVECVRTRERPRTSGAAGVRVVRVLDALQRSLRAGGEPQMLVPEPPIAPVAK